jgi:hypothetical protein
MSDKRRTPPTTAEMTAWINQQNANDPPYTEPVFTAARSFDEWLAMRTAQANHQPTSSPGCTWRCCTYGHDEVCLRAAWNAALRTTSEPPNTSQAGEA